MDGAPKARASLIAKTAFVASIFAVALSFLFTGIFDPLGQREEAASAVSRQTVALVLCAVVEETETRAETASDPEEEEALRKSADRYHSLVKDLLHYRCEDGLPRPIVTL